MVSICWSSHETKNDSFIRWDDVYSPNSSWLAISIYLNINVVGTGLDVDEYVRRSYKFAYSDCIEVGPVACLPEPPDPNELYTRKSSRQVYLLLACGVLFWTSTYFFIVILCGFWLTYYCFILLLIVLFSSFVCCHFTKTILLLLFLLCVILMCFSAVHVTFVIIPGISL